MGKERIYAPQELLLHKQTEMILNSSAKSIGQNFYHYTRVDVVKDILRGDDRGNRFFFVSNISVMNDTNEAELHRETGTKVHSFCTCSSKHEKIPLWYLYSGICGNGARLGFSPGRMLKFIKGIHVVYPVVNKTVDYDRPLHIDKDFELECGWVYYLMDGNNRVVHCNNIYSIETANIDVLKKCYFIKDYPWEYEKEFRVVIHNKTDNIYNQLAIPIPMDIISKLEVMSAPERCFTNAEKEELTQFGIALDRIKSSQLGVCMKLISNNRQSILEQLGELLGDNPQIVCEYVQSKRKCQKDNT